MKLIDINRNLLFKNMEQHHRISIEESVEQEAKPAPKAPTENLLPASILVAAVLLSASMFYNTKLILKKLDGGLAGANSQVAGGAANAGNGPQAAPSVPTEPVEVSQRGDAPVLGNNSAKVVLEEFSDFQCPYCQRFFKETFGELMAKYVDTGKMKIIFRHFPLPFHANAQKAAEAGECAQRLGRFKEYHDVLFSKGKADGTGLAMADLKQYAADLGLNTNRFNQCLDKGEAADVVTQDKQDGQTAGVSGTPTIFVNGKKIVGAQPTSVFEQAIEAALKE